MPPQGLFSKAVLQSSDRDPMIFEVHIVHGEHQGFAHAQAIMVNQTKERAVPGGVDHREEVFELVLGEAFG
jgi:hypothetical protein